MKPVTFPMIDLRPVAIRSTAYLAGRLPAACRRPWPWRSCRRASLGGVHLAERALVLVREHLDELGRATRPSGRGCRARAGAGPPVVVLDQLLQHRLVGLALVPDRAVDAGLLLGRGSTLLERHHRGVAALGEVAVLVVDVGDAAAHAGREVAAGLAEHDHRAAGHVLAAMVAGAFDHRRRARQAHREALARHAAEEGLAAGRAVQHGVADDDVLASRRRGSRCSGG